MIPVPVKELQLAALRVLLTKCTFADSELDHQDKGSVLNLFQGKKVGKMPKYIKELISLDNDLRHDKKLMKKLF